MESPIELPGSGRQPVPPEREFVQRMFTWLAPRYDATVLLCSLGLDLYWKHALLAPLRAHHGARALDLACGTGLILERIRRGSKDDSVVGLDANRSMLTARERHRPGSPRVQASAEALPFRSRSFDLVTAGYLPKYVRLDRLSREVHRVLQPGGCFATYDFARPTPGALGRLYGVYIDRVLPWFGHRMDRTSPMWATMMEFLRDVTRESGWEDRIGNALRTAGFNDVRVRPAMGGSVSWVWAVAEDPSTMSVREQG